MSQGTILLAATLKMGAKERMGCWPMIQDGRCSPQVFLFSVSFQMKSQRKELAKDLVCICLYCHCRVPNGGSEHLMNATSDSPSDSSFLTFMTSCSFWASLNTRLWFAHLCFILECSRFCCLFKDVV